MAHSEMRQQTRWRVYIPKKYPPATTRTSVCLGTNAYSLFIARSNCELRHRQGGFCTPQFGLQELFCIRQKPLYFALSPAILRPQPGPPQPKFSEALVPSPSWLRLHLGWDGMWTAILNIVSWVLGFIRPRSEAEKAYDTGKDAGIIQQQKADLQGELDAAKTAKDASDGVSDDVGQLLNDPANHGPAAR